MAAATMSWLSHNLNPYHRNVGCKVSSCPTIGDAEAYKQAAERVYHEYQLTDDPEKKKTFTTRNRKVSELVHLASMLHYRASSR